MEDRHAEPLIRDAAPVRVRDAEPKWGCAYKRCLSKARFVVVTAEGNEWGACRAHLKEVRRAAEAE